VRGLLYAWGAEDDIISASIQDAKEQIFVNTAKLQYLDALGSNVGVFRPAAVNLADAQFRQLIPVLSFYPKQVLPTIIKVLDAFFEANNPDVLVRESNPNEIVIQIPSSVPSLRRSVRGSHHFHSYSGTITAVDNTLKTVTVDMIEKTLVADELKDAFLGQDISSFPILSNPAGSTGVVIQFSVGNNLSPLTVGQKFVVSGVKNYAGSFFPETTKSFTVTKSRGFLGQNIVAGNIYPVITMTDCSGIPDSPGRLVFKYGRSGEEADVKYYGRPNNTTLLIDPTYNFSSNHTIGDVVNVIVKPYRAPRISGADYSVYITGVTAARILAQQIVESIVAAGVVIRWEVVEPKC
jgi:hypothetical protein